MTRHRFSSFRSLSLPNASAALPVAAALLVVLGCAGGSDRDAAETSAQSTQMAAPQAPAPSGPIDAQLAEHGESLFRAKGCNGCHTIGGGRLTGPDLAGVTERREYGWTLAMITKPDSMIKSDPTARQLFAEYMTPMLNMNITPDEARAIYEYLRGENEEDS